MTTPPTGDEYRFLPSDQDRRQALASLLETLDLQRIAGREVPVFEGPSQATAHGRVFGGQVLGQALRAAGLTVAPDVPAHSLHAYFLRAGDTGESIRFAVTTLRDGRSFSVRRVDALQHDRPILTMDVSFQRPDADGLHHQAAMPEVPGPEGLPSFADTVSTVDDPLARFMAQRRPLDIRSVLPPVVLSPDPQPRPENTVWMRPVGPLPDDPHLLQAVLAYSSDYTLLEPALRAHGLAWTTPMRIASLDHAMWFHAPVPADTWLLYNQRSSFAGGGRALGSGEIFTRDGTLVASVAQEGMLRPGR